MNFIKAIQPIGGISFRDESVIRTGDAYETCLHIMDYPTDLDKFWLANITGINETVATIDISTNDINKVKRNINRSMKEQNHRYETATNYTSATEAKNKFLDMQELLDEISGMEEVMKDIDARIFLCDRSWVGLDERVKKTKETLAGKNGGFLACTNLNETKTDWESMYEPYRIQQQNNYAVEGQAVTASAIAGGNPFHFSFLEDPNGTFYGTTDTGGNVLLDIFQKTATRRFYNFLSFGTMGAGKSTLLKKIFTDRASRGDFVRTFDISGEFALLTKEFGGSILKLDGTDENALNPMEILKAGEDDSVNYTRHISKLITIYRFLVPEAEQAEITTFSNCLYEFYDYIGLTPKEGRSITGLPAMEYPIFSDFHEYMEQKKEEIADGDYNEVDIVVAQNKLLTLSKIDNEIVKLINTYGTMFNRHTSMNNILDEQIITFDISKLKDMDSHIFDAQIFSMISLCWDNLVTNGKKMIELWREEKIRFEDIVRSIILIDEAHRWINVEKLQALDMITTYMRESRKYFGGIGLASQSIRDYVPEGCDSVSLNKLKTLFELTQYKFIMHQNTNVIPLIKTAFDNVLTDTQIDKVPKLSMGRCILSIESTCNVEFEIFITEEEEYLFNGGA